jgi:ribosomal protein S18 acetylase RimI-like enzyme
MVTGAGGRLVAAAACEHWAGEPGSLDLTWGAARRFRLTAHVDGPEVANNLDLLLLAWREHLATDPAADGEGAAAVVTWPSREVEGVPVLLRHGLVPLAVVAARITPPRRAVPLEGAAAIRIRRAGTGDVEAVVRLGLETIRFDAHFGVVTERPDTATALRAMAAQALDGHQPWVWLAEHDTPGGMIWAQEPGDAGPVAAMTSLAPAAYILLAGVTAKDRGRGIATALTARAHHDIGAAGAAVTLLHYAVTNPLSAPFWARQHYRPLWTIWQTRPARRGAQT